MQMEKGHIFVLHLHVNDSVLQVVLVGVTGKEGDYSVYVKSKLSLESTSSNIVM